MSADFEIDGDTYPLPTTHFRLFPAMPAAAEAQLKGFGEPAGPSYNPSPSPPSLPPLLAQTILRRGDACDASHLLTTPNLRDD